MLYFGCSGVTENDLENAAKSIEQMLKEPGAEEYTRAKQQWIDALEVHSGDCSFGRCVKQKANYRHRRGR
jgi:hypothetical protein